jgi:hypothetical protein
VTTSTVRNGGHGLHSHAAAAQIDILNEVLGENSCSVLLSSLRTAPWQPLPVATEVQVVNVRVQWAAVQS